MPLLMAILNVTPDSFSDGGRFLDVDSAVAHARRLLDEGADVIDVGGESTRPGAGPVAPQEQIRRVVAVIARIAPILAGVRSRLSASAGSRAGAGRDATIDPSSTSTDASPWSAGSLPTISIDTCSAQVAAAALDAGATIVNDVSAGRDDPTMLDLVASRRAGLVLMHRRVAPSKDSYSDRYTTPPIYVDVVRDVAEFLRERVAAAVGAGVAHDAVAIDPGLGFGKSVEQNHELLARLDELRQVHPRVLVGASRKSFVAAADAATRGSPPADRLGGSIAAALVATERGAAVLRIHDVAATRQALAVARRARAGPG